MSLPETQTAAADASPKQPVITAKASITLYTFTNPATGQNDLQMDVDYHGDEFKPDNIAHAMTCYLASTIQAQAERLEREQSPLILPPGLHHGI